MKKLLAFTSAFGGSALVGALVLAAGVGVSTPAFALPPPWVVFCRNISGWGTNDFNEGKFEACTENVEDGGGTPTPESNGEACLVDNNYVPPNSPPQTPPSPWIENWGVASGGNEVVLVEFVTPDIQWGAQACIATS